MDLLAVHSFVADFRFCFILHTLKVSRKSMMRVVDTFDIHLCAMSVDPHTIDFHSIRFMSLVVTFPHQFVPFLAHTVCVRVSNVGFLLFSPPQSRAQDSNVSIMHEHPVSRITYLHHTNDCDNNDSLLSFQ